MKPNTYTVPIVLNMNGRPIINSIQFLHQGARNILRNRDWLTNLKGGPKGHISNSKVTDNVVKSSTLSFGSPLFGFLITKKQIKKTGEMFFTHIICYMFPNPSEVSVEILAWHLKILWIVVSRNPITRGFGLIALPQTSWFYLLTNISKMIFAHNSNI